MVWFNEPEKEILVKVVFVKKKLVKDGENHVNIRNKYLIKLLQIITNYYKLLQILYLDII